MDNKNQPPPKQITCGERPASVYFRGGEVMIYVHDNYHRIARSRMLQDLAALHPDGHGRRRRLNPAPRPMSYTFIRAMELFNTWLREEFIWYRAFGLLPPKGKVKVKLRPFLFNYSEGKNGQQYYKYVSAVRTKRVRVKEAHLIEEGGVCLTAIAVAAQ